jgi:hypothetical protein
MGVSQSLDGLEWKIPQKRLIWEFGSTTLFEETSMIINGNDDEWVFTL